MSDIEASLRLEIAQYQQQLARARGQAQKFRDDLRKAGRGLGGDFLGPLKGAIGGLGMGILAREAVQATLKMEQLRKMLLTTTGSAEAAALRFEELREVSRLPGIGFEQAVRGDVKLRAVGLSADQSKRAIIEFGNALALVGGNREDLDGVFLALSQISSKGKVFAEEINQIAERVPQVRAVMKDVFGTANTEEIQKMGLASEDFINALVDGFARLDRAQAGMQDDLAEMRTLYLEIADAVAGPLVSAAIPALRQLAEMVAANTDGLKAMGETAAGVLTVLVQMLQTARDVGFAGAAMFDGKNFGEVFAEEQRKREAAQRAEEEARKKAAEGATGGGESGAAPAPAGGFDPKEFERIKERMLRLDEKRWAMMVDTLPLLQQEAAIGEKIAGIREEIAGLGEDATAQERRIELEGQILDLTRDQAKVREQINREAAEAAAKAEAQERAKMGILTEIAILQAEASGNDRRAEQLREQAQIAEDVRRIMEETGMAEAEALKLAQEKARLQKQMTNEEDGGRKKIRGYSSKQGGIDEANARAKQRNEEGRLRREQAYARSFGGLDAVEKMRQAPFGSATLTGPEEFNRLKYFDQPMGATAAKNAQRESMAGAARGGSTDDLLEKAVAILQKGLLGE